VLQVRIVWGVVEGGIEFFLEVWNGVISDTVASPSTLLLVGHVDWYMEVRSKNEGRVCCARHAKKKHETPNLDTNQVENN
jgi:hypothetical protein